MAHKYWKHVDSCGNSGDHYSIMQRKDAEFNGMAALRECFPNGIANEMNFVLFSTSGIHGSYTTIEEASSEMEREPEITFQIIQPRIVCIKYGTCKPESQKDLDYLSKLRKSSHEVIAKIGL